MPTLNTTGVIAVIFESNTDLTIGSNTFTVQAGVPIGIPYSTDSITVGNADESVLCMLNTIETQAKGLQVFVANEIRVTSA